MILIQAKERIAQMFSDLQFDSQRHLYFVEGVRFPSVTGLVHTHQEPFNPSNEMMMACVKKYNRENGENITEHELKHKWQTTNIEACKLGTDTHDFLERYTGLESPKLPQEIAGIKFFTDILVDYEIVAREVRMYSRVYGFAGTADLLLLHKATGKLVLADYKTNKDLFKNFGMLKAPFGYLEQHPYNLYQLQLSYYQIILEEAGLAISDRLLVYLMADENYKIYNLYDFTKDLTECLKLKQVQHESNHSRTGNTTCPIYVF